MKKSFASLIYHLSAMSCRLVELLLTIVSTIRGLSHRRSLVLGRGAQQTLLKTSCAPLIIDNY